MRKAYAAKMEKPTFIKLTMRFQTLIRNSNNSDTADKKRLMLIWIIRGCHGNIVDATKVGFVALNNMPVP
jgi:hypothetical protein